MEPRLILAPLAGYTDKAFRKIARSYGAEAAVTEMVSAEGLARESGKTEALLDRYPGEDRLITQIFAPSADPVRRCLPRLLSHGPDMIDINCGCPVPKVVRTGSGSALMKEPQRIYEIVRAVKDSSTVPVSVKFRLGWDSSSINYLEFADKAAEAGASILTLHARTRAQNYSGTADWNAIRTLSEHFKGSGIRIFASGDVFSAEAARTLMEDYGADGVMFARGAIGNPFIFRETKDLLEGKEPSLPTARERVEAAEEHLALAVAYYGESVAVKEMRKHLMAYIKGIPGANKVKAGLSGACTLEGVKSLLGTLSGVSDFS